MSLYEFNKAEVLVAMRIPFKSLIMAAIRSGDVPSQRKLQAEWPNIYHEVKERLNDEKSYSTSDNQQRRLL